MHFYATIHQPVRILTFLWSLTILLYFGIAIMHDGFWYHPPHPTWADIFIPLPAVFTDHLLYGFSNQPPPHYHGRLWIIRSLAIVISYRFMVPPLLTWMTGYVHP